MLKLKYWALVLTFYTFLSFAESGPVRIFSPIYYLSSPVPVLIELEGENCHSWHDLRDHSVCQLISDEYELSIVFQKINGGYFPARLSGWMLKDYYFENIEFVDQRFRLGEDVKLRGDFSLMKKGQHYLVEYTFKLSGDKIELNKDVLDLD